MAIYSCFSRHQWSIEVCRRLQAVIESWRTAAYNGAPIINVCAELEKIFVTGAAGFVGAALCTEMQRRTIPFVPAVRKATRPEERTMGDLAGAIDWEPLLAGCNAVIHLAGRVHQMREASGDPAAIYRKVNVEATAELARAAARVGVRRFVFVSTIKVNGEYTSIRPFRSDDIPQPSDAYARSKWEAELILNEICSLTGMELVIIRPPLVYGPGVGANFLKLMKLVHSGMLLPFGGVHNLRSLVAVDNLVDFLLLCASSRAAAGRTFLVSDQDDISTADLVRLIARAMNKPARLLPVSSSWLSTIAAILGKKEAASRVFASLQVDTGPTRHLLNWTPALSVDQGVRRAVQHFLVHR